MDCLFCKIAAGEIPSAKLYEDDQVLVFRDIDPKAPVHFLAIPKAHIGCADDITPQNSAIVGRLFEVIAQVAAKEGLKNGYRIVNNCGEDGGQTVHHLHFHVLGGRGLAWPPG